MLRLHHGVTPGAQVHSEHSQKRLAHYLYYVINILYLLIQHMLTRTQGHNHQRKNAQNQYKPLQKALVISQKKIIGNCYHAYPALVGHSVVNTALITLQVNNIIGITLAQLAKDLVHIGLLFFNAQAPITNGKHDIAIRVAQIIIALARQAVIGQKRIKLLGIKVHRQHIITMT